MDCDVLCLPTEDNLCEVMYVCASVLITETLSECHCCFVLWTNKDATMILNK